MEVPLSHELETKLARLAAQQGKESSVLVIEAVERFVSYDEWFLTEVDKGLAQIDSGKTLSHEEVGLRLARSLAHKSSSV